MASYETIIGVETHVELSTKSKIFCSCPAGFGAAPNTQVCPVCLGLPGVLPVLNREAFMSAVKVGLALHCRVAQKFKFDRKHYYYPDLPKNFQISQYDKPVAEDGSLSLPSGTKVRVKRVHLEEDAGKLVHEGEGEKIGGATAALVDYNRSGVPLLEIVTEPDLRDPAQTVEYLKALRAIVRYLKISTGNMEEGSLRCEANISIRPEGQKELGTKVEIKNLNSFKSVERSLEYEISRQRLALENGERIVQETRLFDEAAGETRTMRSKEHAHDYRYFPEPDLPLFTVDPFLLSKLKGQLPELPEARRARMVSEHGLPEYDAGVLTADRDTADFFEEAVGAGAQPKTASNWIMGDFAASLNEAGIPITRSKVTPAMLTGLISLIENGAISGKIAKTVFAEMFRSGREAGEVVDEENLTQISDEEGLRKTIVEVLLANPQSVTDFKGGKKQALGFLVGQVMKATSGKANPQMVNQLLTEEMTKQ